MVDDDKNEQRVVDEIRVKARVESRAQAAENRRKQAEKNAPSRDKNKK